MLGSILRTGFVRDVRFSGRVTFAWIPHALKEAQCRIPLRAWRLSCLSIRFLLFTAGDEITFVFVGFAIWNQTPIEQSTSIV
jgi:hypothetical protein